MKVSHLFAALAIAASGAAFAADKHADGHEIKPMHGGAVAEAKDIDYELVTKADKLQLYMRDHGKPLDPAGMSAKVTLLSGSDKQEAQLLREARSALERRRQLVRDNANELQPMLVKLLPNLWSR